MSSEQDPVIVGIGMMTAVGLTARETAAAVRAGAMRFTESKLFDQRAEPFTLAEVPQEGLPPLVQALDETTGLTSREMRLLRLAARPLADCLAGLPKTESHPGLILALPETQTTRRLDGAAFLENLWKQSGGTFDLKRSVAPHSGRAGGVIAIAHAAEAIRTNQARFMVAGAVDTYRDLHILGFLDIEKRVKSSAHLDGFIPGEGAAFLLLTQPVRCVSRGTSTPGSGFAGSPNRRARSPLQQRAISRRWTRCRSNTARAIGHREQADRRGLVVDERRESLGEGMERRIHAQSVCVSDRSRHDPSGRLHWRYRRSVWRHPDRSRGCASGRRTRTTRVPDLRLIRSRRSGRHDRGSSLKRADYD